MRSIVGLENGGKFPIEYTGRGKDISPEIIIHNLSPKAKTIAITLEDTTHIIKDFPSVFIIVKIFNKNNDFMFARKTVHRRIAEQK